VEASLSALGFAPFESIRIAGAEGCLACRVDARSLPGARKSNAKIDLIGRNSRAFTASINFRRRLPAARQGAARLPHYEAGNAFARPAHRLGYREILTILTFAEERDALFRPGGISPARLSNPLSEEANVLALHGLVTMPRRSNGM